MQDQHKNVQQEHKVQDEVQDEVQEGQEEEEAVPEDVLRARLPRLKGRLEAPAARGRVRGDGGGLTAVSFG